MGYELVQVATLYVQHGEVGKYAATPTGRKALTERFTQGCLSQVPPSKRDVAGSPLFSESGTVETKPAAILYLAGELVHPICVVKGSLARIQFANASERLGLNGTHPIP